MHEITAHSKRKAVAYVVGEFVLNGKLSCTKKTSVMISQRLHFHYNQPTYKTGNGKSKASFPEPVVKYVKKLTKNFGSIINGNTIFIVMKFMALLIISICSLALAYVVLDSGYGIPGNEYQIMQKCFLNLN